jgi:hypothetical protein
MEKENNLIGKKVVKVYLSGDKDWIKFVCDDNTVIKAQAYGDCCSNTWIEAVEGVEQIAGKTITRIEDITLRESEEIGEYGETTQFYGLKIHSDSGYMLIDYRNNSNGYYGGDLVWEGDYWYNAEEAEAGIWNEVK